MLGEIQPSDMEARALAAAALSGNEPLLFAALQLQ